MTTRRTTTHRRDPKSEKRRAPPRKEMRWRFPLSRQAGYSKPSSSTANAACRWGKVTQASPGTASGRHGSEVPSSNPQASSRRGSGQASTFNSVIPHSPIWSLEFGVSSFATAPAQPPPPPPPQDPLMSLMISQPRIELNGPVNPAAWFDPPVVQFGEESIYRVTLNALEQTVEWPAEITSTPRLEMRSGARGEILRMGGTNLLPLTAFNYHVRASAIGDYIVPQFTVHVHGQPV